jgi:cell division septation protein DedD
MTMRKNLQNIIIMFFALSYFLAAPAAAQKYGPEQKITVVQNFPAAVRPGSDFMMEIKISKGNITGLAKFQQYIPSGMTATAMASAGADFSFEQQNVKFIWTSVAPDAEITLRYKISVSPTLSGKKFLSGTFSYVENDRTKKSSLVPKEIDVTPGAPVVEMPAAESTSPTTQPEKAEPTASVQKEDLEPEEKDEPASTGASAAETTPPVAIEKKQAEETKPAETTEPASTATSTTATNSTAAENKPAETPDNVTAPASSGIVFKVQIAAMNEKHFRRKNYFQEKFGLQMEVNTEEHEGLKKYTVGSFTSYAQARKLRDEIMAKVDGSFVVAYKDGVRIPVAEAMELLRKK